jgi:lysophospholipid hydrolase
MKKLAEDWFEMIHYDYLGHAGNLTYPYISVFSGDYFNTTVKRTVGETIMIEDLWLPYYCCTTDISDLNSRQHNNGWLWRYVRASMTYSSVLPPICDPRDGHLLVDGCYSENVPGKAMKKSGVKYLLAMDIATMDERNLTNYGDTLSGTWTWFDKIKPFGKQKLKIPDSIEIQLRLAFCSHYRNLEELQNDPDFEYLCPDLGKFTSSDFGNFKDIYELGYNHATTYLAGMRKLK